MKLSDENKLFLEINLFKGRIIDRHTGRGGLIYKVERDCNPRFLAYKTVKEFESENYSCITTESIKNIEREVGNWFKYSNHPLLIKPFDVNIVNGFPMVSMPYCNGDISHFIQSRLSLIGVICFSIQIIKGLIEAKKAGLIYHQDIKPENILYVDLSDKFRNFPGEGVDPSLKYSIRIADFGVANAYFDNHLGGTNVYKSPEQHDEKTFKGQFEPDVFAVGLIIAELFQGYHPATTSENVNIKKWKGSKLKKWAFSGKRNYQYPKNEVEEKLMNLIDKMLIPNPELRPNLKSCYDNLFEILKNEAPKSALLLNCIIEHYDSISTVNFDEDHFFNLIKLSKLDSQLDSILEAISLMLLSLISSGAYTPDSIIKIYRHAKALYNICNTHKLEDYNTLISSASEIVIYYLINNHQNITSSLLYPTIDNRTLIGSDFEARAQVFNESLNILLELNYSVPIQSAIDSSTDNTIKAFVIFNAAQKFRVAGNSIEAYQKLCELRTLIPIDIIFEEVFHTWKAQACIFLKK
ncbi:protein kinase [Nissabacter sp. SGAir0207]|uniref:protein kinase domain-containing protein n=1 Tax=Nissabacter sp. SGAir0207 TaxID=2126321 RepID=UPI00143D2AA9|nr:protein kinase [Nissabacter sp. SGAir0207]